MEEQWKNLQFIGWPEYEVSNFGRVRSRKNGRGSRKKKMVDGYFILKPFVSKLGYPQVIFLRDRKRKYQYVHRLVALAFVPNPNNYPLVNHKDENRSNNQFNNLEWCTPSYNITYKEAVKRRLETKLKNKPLTYKISKGDETHFFKNMSDIAAFLKRSKRMIGYYINQSPYHVCGGYLLERITAKNG